MTRGGTPKNNKRKSTDAVSLQKSTKGKMPGFLTPQPGQNAKKGNTPKSTNKPQQKPMTPQQQKSSTPKQLSNKKQTPKQMTPNQQKPAVNSNKKSQASNKQNGKKTPQIKKIEDKDDEDDEEDDEIQFKDSALFKGLLQGMKDDDEDDDEDDEDDDEDDEDDDEDIQPPTKKSKIEKQMKVTEMNDDDDDEDSAEEDDEDSAEEDDEVSVEDDDKEEEEEQAPPSKKAKKVNAQDSSDKDKPSLKAKTNPQEAPNKPESGKSTQLSPEDEERQREKRAKTLFMKNLHPSVTPAQIKAFSSDIRNLRIRAPQNATKKKKYSLYAYVEFASEKLANKNKPVLSKIVIKGMPVHVDFIGEKSDYKPKNKAPKTVHGTDPLRLYVAGIPHEAKEADLRKVFPKATSIDLPSRNKGKRPFGYGFVHFTSEKLAKQYHDQCQGADLKGNRLIVLFAKKTAKATQQQKAPLKRENKETGPQQSKKAKKEQPSVKKEEEEDDEDDEDEDDNEEGMDDQEEGENDDDDDDDGDDDDDDDDDEDDDED